MNATYPTGLCRTFNCSGAKMRRRWYRRKPPYTKSVIGYPRDQKGTVAALGLKRLNQTVELADTPQIRGMVHKVQHLVTITGPKGEKA